MIVALARKLLIAFWRLVTTDALPLPSETGAAEHPIEERPATSNVGPYDEPITTKSVKRAVLAGYRRCGWTRTPIHILRQCMA